MSDIKPCEVWAVVGPDGLILIHTVSDTAVNTISKADPLDRRNWKLLLAAGYTVCPVTITGRKDAHLSGKDRT